MRWAWGAYGLKFANMKSVESWNMQKNELGFDSLFGRAAAAVISGAGAALATARLAKTANAEPFMMIAVEVIGQTQMLKKLSRQNYVQEQLSTKVERVT
jgi:hypothetical protein